MENYELLQQIGKGSYGRVYTARNYVDHELYVLKRIPVDAASPSEADAAVREAHVLSLLRHPHVVPYKEFFKFDGDLCLVMAHCEGGDLFAHAKALRKAGKAVEEDKAWQWLVQLLLALSYCHSKKILHRDVKTQNVFLTRDGRALLGDFGLAKQLQRTLEMARTPIGTPYYMAPEIYEEAPYSFKSDVWALGCVMFEVLTGRPAFAADNLSRVVIRVLRGTYDPLPSTYSQELRDIIGMMLTKDVASRPTANDLLQHPSVVPRVQAYLDQLSSAGAKASWHTWRMKLPPTILSQMADIISKASSRPSSRPTSAATSSPQQAQQAASRQPVLGAGALSQLQDLMSSTELIEGFGLQSLLDGHVAAGAAGGEAELDPEKELLAATLHPEDRKKLALLGDAAAGGVAGGQISELRVLKSQMNVVHSKKGLSLHGPAPSTSDAGQAGGLAPGEQDYVRPAAQLLGMSHSQRNFTGRQRDAEEPDFALLSAGLPKAGFGFGAPLSPAAADAETPRLKSGAKGALVPTSTLRKGANGASPLSPLIRANLGFPDTGGYGIGGKDVMWKQGTSMKNISLHDTLTNRAAFLRKDLEAKLGRELLAAASQAVRRLRDHAEAADDEDEEVDPGKLQAALRGVGATAEQLEAAPLVDELVLLQERCYAG